MQRKLEKIGEKARKFLDFATPRAAPRNSFVLFLPLEAILVDNGSNCCYNTGMKKMEKQMTINQFDLLLMHGGMMHDGLSSDEAIAALMIMEEPEEDINWLIKQLNRRAKKNETQ